MSLAEPITSGSGASYFFLLVQLNGNQMTMAFVPISRWSKKAMALHPLPGSAERHMAVMRESR